MMRSHDVGAMRRSSGPRPRLSRTALVLIAVAPLAACGVDTLARDPFGDAAARCGDRPREWLPGCATQRNLAAMADKPADLDKPRREGARDSMRRDALFSGYNRSASGGEPRPVSQPATPGDARKAP